jgi:2'-5' RNA ligase
VTAGAADEAKYIMPCLLKAPVSGYQRELVDAIAERFGLTFTQGQAIPAHFTLKYHFTTAEIGQVEALLERFAREHPRTPVTIGGFGHFLEDVVFVEVELSRSAKRLFEALVSTLRTLPWMPWDQFDAENLHPHMTIAERCGPGFPEVWEFLKPLERRFSAWFDNITILRKVGERDGMDRWAVHRSFELGAG